MAETWLADTDPRTAWALHPWTAFHDHARSPAASGVAILPVHGFADHGLGLPLDIEESLLAPVLRSAVASLQTSVRGTVRVLPPLRFGPAPHPNCFFGVDADTALALVLDLARGVRRAGFGKLVLLSTHPWHRELLDVASLDAQSHGVFVYRIHSAALGLDFHPASPDRAALRRLGAAVLRRQPQPASAPADERDVDFRPGHHHQPAPLNAPLDLEGIVPDATAFLESSARQLATLLSEIDAHSAGDLFAPAPEARPRPPAISISLPDIAPHAPYGGRYLPALTRPVLEALPARERAVVVLPTSAIEQHGAHLPVGLDAIVGEAVLSRALTRLPADALVFVAPPLLYGKSTEHDSWAGTLSLETSTFRRLFLAQAHELHRLGFRQLVAFNTHGGNSGVLVYTLRELQSSPGLRAGMFGVGRPSGLSDQEFAFGFHGGEWETSVMLAIAPGLVDMTKAVRDFPARLDDPGELRPVRGAATFGWRTENISRTGIMGDATAASREKGLRWLDEAASTLAARLLALLESAPPPRTPA